MKPEEALDLVEDPDSFLKFVEILIADTGSENSIEEWQNTTIEAFLESAVAWAKDSDFGVRQGLSENNPWKQFAVFLHCGKIYE